MSNCVINTLSVESREAVIIIESNLHNIQVKQKTQQIIKEITNLFEKRM